MASPNTRAKQAMAAAKQTSPAMTRVQLAITGVVERYGPDGRMIESKALAEHPIGIAAMSAAALSEDLAELTEPLAALWPAAADEPAPTDPVAGAEA